MASTRHNENSLPIALKKVDVSMEDTSPRKPLKDLSNQISQETLTSGIAIKENDPSSVEGSNSRRSSGVGGGKSTSGGRSSRSSVTLDSTDDFESADEELAEVSVSQLAEELKRLQVDTPKQRSPKTFKFPYSPLEKDVLKSPNISASSSTPVKTSPEEENTPKGPSSLNKVTIRKSSPLASKSVEEYRSGQLEDFLCSNSVNFAEATEGDGDFEEDEQTVVSSPHGEIDVPISDSPSDVNRRKSTSYFVHMSRPKPSNRNSLPADMSTNQIESPRVSCHESKSTEEENDNNPEVNTLKSCDYGATEGENINSSDRSIRDSHTQLYSTNIVEEVNIGFENTNDLKYDGTIVKEDSLDLHENEGAMTVSNDKTCENENICQYTEDLPKSSLPSTSKEGGQIEVQGTLFSTEIQQCPENHCNISASLHQECKNLDSQSNSVELLDNVPLVSSSNLSMPSPKNVSSILISEPVVVHSLEFYKTPNTDNEPSSAKENMSTQNENEPEWSSTSPALQTLSTHVEARQDSHTIQAATSQLGLVETSAIEEIKLCFDYNVEPIGKTTLVEDGLTQVELVPGSEETHHIDHEIVGCIMQEISYSQKPHHPSSNAVPRDIGDCDTPVDGKSISNEDSLPLCGEKTDSSIFEEIELQKVFGSDNSIQMTAMESELSSQLGSEFVSNIEESKPCSVDFSSRESQLFDEAIPSQLESTPIIEETKNFYSALQPSDSAQLQIDIAHCMKSEKTIPFACEIVDELVQEAQVCADAALQSESFDFEYTKLSIDGNIEPEFLKTSTTFKPDQNLNADEKCHPTVAPAEILGNANAELNGVHNIDITTSELSASECTLPIQPASDATTLENSQIVVNHEPMLTTESLESGTPSLSPCVIENVGSENTAPELPASERTLPIQPASDAPTFENSQIVVNHEPTFTTESLESGSPSLSSFVIENVDFPSTSPVKLTTDNLGSENTAPELKAAEFTLTTSDTPAIESAQIVATQEPECSTKSLESEPPSQSQCVVENENFLQNSSVLLTSVNLTQNSQISLCNIQEFKTGMNETLDSVASEATITEVPSSSDIVPSNEAKTEERVNCSSENLTSTTPIDPVALQIELTTTSENMAESNLAKLLQSDEIEVSRICNIGSTTASPAPAKNNELDFTTISTSQLDTEQNHIKNCDEDKPSENEDIGLDREMTSTSSCKIEEVKLFPVEVINSNAELPVQHVDSESMNLNSTETLEMPDEAYKELCVQEVNPTSTKPVVSSVTEISGSLKTTSTTSEFIKNAYSPSVEIPDCAEHVKPTIVTPPGDSIVESTSDVKITAPSSSPLLSHDCSSLTEIQPSKVENLKQRDIQINATCRNFKDLDRSIDTQLANIMSSLQLANKNANKTNNNTVDQCSPVEKPPLPNQTSLETIPTPSDLLKRYNISPKKPEGAAYVSPFSKMTPSERQSSNTVDLTKRGDLFSHENVPSGMQKSYKDLSSLLEACSKQEKELGTLDGLLPLNIRANALKISEEIRRASRHGLSCPPEEPRMQSSFSGDINTSEAGPVTAGEDLIPDSFQNATDFDFEYLSTLGGRGALSSKLARQSLFVKFDPIVGKLISSPSRNTPIKTMAENQSSSEESQLDSTRQNDSGEPLIPFTPGTGVKASATRPSSGGHTPSLRQEISKLQDLMIQQEQAHQEKADLVEELRKRIAELEASERPVSGDLEVSLIAKDEELGRIKEELADALNSNKQLIQVMEEYEKTISQLVTMKEETKAHYEHEKEAIAAERDTAMRHLTNLEVAFNDIHQKYERAKGVIETQVANEVELKKCFESAKETIESQKQAYQKFKQHAAEKLQSANSELDNVRKEYNAEMAKMKAIAKKNELKVKSLEESLEQKKKELLEMTQICDELIANYTPAV